MTKKAHKFTVLSGIKCTDCGKLLKLNLVERKKTADRCYKCYRIRQLKHKG